jgi:hypothetical protein
VPQAARAATTDGAVRTWPRRRLERIAEIGGLDLRFARYLGQRVVVLAER